MIRSYSTRAPGAQRGQAHPAESAEPRRPDQKQENASRPSPDRLAARHLHAPPERETAQAGSRIERADVFALPYGALRDLGDGTTVLARKAGFSAVLLAEGRGFATPQRFGNAKLFSRWYADVRYGKHVVVVVVSGLGPSQRHWIVTAYVARRLTEGEVQWKRS